MLHRIKKPYKDNRKKKISHNKSKTSQNALMNKKNCHFPKVTGDIFKLCWFNIALNS